MIGKARMKLWKQNNFYTFNLSCFLCGQLEDEKLQDPDRVGLLPSILSLEMCVRLCIYIYE